MATGVSEGATRIINSGTHGAAIWQNHHRGLGDGARGCCFHAGSLSVVACPAQRQSAEAVRRVRDCVLKAGSKLKADNVYGLELANGARVLALPGSDDSIRGLTVDAWIVADEAARLSRRSDRGVAADARAATGSALCHVVDRMEPHRPVLDRVGER